LDQAHPGLTAPPAGVNRRRGRRDRVVSSTSTVAASMRFSRASSSESRRILRSRAASASAAEPGPGRPVRVPPCSLVTILRRFEVASTWLRRVHNEKHHSPPPIGQPSAPTDHRDPAQLSDMNQRPLTSLALMHCRQKIGALFDCDKEARQNLVNAPIFRRERNEASRVTRKHDLGVLSRREAHVALGSRLSVSARPSGWVNGCSRAGYRAETAGSASTSRGCAGWAVCDRRAASCRARCAR
jgi:hypothetical protein